MSRQRRWLVLPCSQCGNTIYVDEGAAFVRCYNCTQTSYLSDEVLVGYFHLRPTLALAEASEVMRGWMKAQAGPAHLDGVAVLGPPKAYDFLFWSFSGGANGYDCHTLVPAVQTALHELRQVQVPTRFVNPDASIESEGEVLEPTVTREAAMSTAGETDAESLKTWLVRVPLYEFPYHFNGREYRVIVDGLSGQCLVDRFPGRPWSAWAAVLAACVALFAFEGWMLWDAGPWLGAAFLLTAVPAAWMTWAMMRRRRQAGSEGAPAEPPA